MDLYQPQEESQYKYMLKKISIVKTERIILSTVTVINHML